MFVHIFYMLSYRSYKIVFYLSRDNSIRQQEKAKEKKSEAVADF